MKGPRLYPFASMDPVDEATLADIFKPFWRAPDVDHTEGAWLGLVMPIE